MSKFEVSLKSRIGKVGPETHRLLSQVVRKTALDIEAGAKMRAPVDTGFLRNSITSDMEGDLEAVVSVGAEYGVYQEYGTSRMPAQPFLTPAVEANRRPFHAATAAAVKKGAGG